MGEQKTKQEKIEIAVFGGGCFWCTEAIFARLKGVKSVMPGYAGGDKENPTYDQVSGGRTGHAEVIKIEFDPAVISYKDLLTVFFFEHDPTTLNRQGADTGTQYRSVIFYDSAKQRNEAEKFIKLLEGEKAYDKPIVTEVKPLTNFYTAETYHKDYYERNRNTTYCELIITPKIEKLEKRFSQLLSVKNK